MIVLHQATTSAFYPRLGAEVIHLAQRQGTEGSARYSISIRLSELVLKVR